VVAAVGPAAAVGPTGPTGAGPTAVAAYGKKAKDTGCRPRTAKEEWKEREATLSQALPNRIKIFEGGSVCLATVVMFCHWLLWKQSLIKFMSVVGVCVCVCVCVWRRERAIKTNWRCQLVSTSSRHGYSGVVFRDVLCNTNNNIANYDEEM